ncbi:Transforming acidic coiled-coil-containing protein C-terminal [Trinorchestia longiramus]|nr:Transforming acidic coiled-coil-containing protein C-terminal [Trinorchestia longiramus]
MSDPRTAVRDDDDHDYGDEVSDEEEERVTASGSPVFTRLIRQASQEFLLDLQSYGDEAGSADDSDSDQDHTNYNDNRTDNRFDSDQDDECSPDVSSPITSSSRGVESSNSASNKDKVCGVMAPPPEERSAPEGTSSPTPRPQEASSDKAGYLTQAQVDALLKRQEAQFEERLQRMSQCTSEKEQGLHVKMKEEQKELAELRSAVVEVTQSREALLKMLEQYKEMLAAVVKGKTTMDKEQEQKMKDLEAQKNQALEDLGNVEAAFSDVHRKYERTKQVVETLRRNEETLRGAVADYEGKLKRQEATLVTFQQHAEDKMQQASDEYDKLKKNTDQELTKMGALLKKAEMKIISLQEQLDHKSRDNQELTTLLDDLIAKMGPSK